MERKELHEMLVEFRNGNLSEDEVLLKLREAPFVDLGYAKYDSHRSLRQGAGEVIYGAGKTSAQILGIARTALENGQSRILITKMSDEAAEYVSGEIRVDYEPLSRTGIIGGLPEPDGIGSIAIVTGGTSDLPAAQEAAVTARFLGNEVVSIYDAGVAGLHRLMGSLDELMSANVVIAVAGMEGALASVVGGLVDRPVIAVPTSVGYGASFHGISALLAMLNSCASGVSVVNIDNGFGAAYQASLINHR